MIISDDFIFFHMPRTGGTSITHWLAKKTAAREPIVAFARFKKSDSEAYDKFTTISHAGPVHLNIEDFQKNVFWFSFIRNPFDWYVSKWAMKFQSEYTDFKNWLKPILNEENMKQTSKFLTLNMRFKPSPFPGGPEEWGLVLDDEVKHNPPPSWDLSKELNPKDIKFDIGFMTHRYLQVACAYPLVYFENFPNWINRHDELCMMDKVYKLEDGIENGLKDALEMDVEDFPTKNTSEHKPYQEYYDDELIELVYYKDRFIFDNYGYEF